MDPKISVHAREEQKENKDLNLKSGEGEVKRMTPLLP